MSLWGKWMGFSYKYPSHCLLLTLAFLHWYSVISPVALGSLTSLTMWVWATIWLTTSYSNARNKRQEHPLWMNLKAIYWIQFISLFFTFAICFVLMHFFYMSFFFRSYSIDTNIVTSSITLRRLQQSCIISFTLILYDCNEFYVQSSSRMCYCSTAWPWSTHFFIPYINTVNNAISTCIHTDAHTYILAIKRPLLPLMTFVSYT